MDAGKTLKEPNPKVANPFRLTPKDPSAPKAPKVPNHLLPGASSSSTPKVARKPCKRVFDDFIPKVKNWADEVNKSKSTIDFFDFTNALDQTDLERDISTSQRSNFIPVTSVSRVERNHNPFITVMSRKLRAQLANGFPKLRGQKPEIKKLSKHEKSAFSIELYRYPTAQ